MANIVNVLAFDFGASSGRAILGIFNGSTIKLKEIHRFSNDPVPLNNTLYWDFLRLMYEIRTGLVLARNEGGYKSVGIDTWGVDFGLLDCGGNLLENPIHYRDSRTHDMMDEFFKQIPRDVIYDITGIQFMALNTLYQLYSLSVNRPQILERTDKILFTPDLMAYYLTGVMNTEYTIASTSQLLDARTRKFSDKLLGTLGLSTDHFAPIVEAGTVTGTLSQTLCDELGLDAVPFVRVASHDTASAVAAVPSSTDDYLYLSSGTWSLMGIVSERPIINDRTESLNFTNEGAYGNKIRFLKNIMGLWLIQESRRQWIREGYNISFAEMEELARAGTPFRSLIDPDNELLASPGNIPDRIRLICRETNQPIPESVGEVVRCIYESLALKYKIVKHDIETVSELTYSDVHLVGGGARDSLLAQFTADATGSKVIAGPVEATALGNIAVQLITLGELDSIQHARDIIANSFECVVYEPTNTSVWDSMYLKFKAMFH